MSDGGPDPLEEVRRLVGDAQSLAVKAKQSAEGSTDAASAAKSDAQNCAASAQRASECASTCELLVRNLTACAKQSERGRGERLRRSFQTLWVGGVLGAFFAAVIVTIPDAYRRFGAPVSYVATADLSLRYGYMVWLLAYFFVSNMLNESARHARPKDVWFDVGQSAGAFSVAWSLGFLSPIDGFRTHLITRGLFCANVVIALICGLSLCLFYKDHDGANRYRWFGLILTVPTLGLWWPLKMQGCEMLTAASISLILLTLVLVFYIVGRVHSLPE